MSLLDKLQRDANIAKEVENKEAIRRKVREEDCQRNQLIRNREEPEFKRLLHLIEQKIAQVNRSVSNLPPFKFHRGEINHLTLDKCAAYITKGRDSDGGPYLSINWGPAPKLDGTIPTDMRRPNTNSTTVHSCRVDSAGQIVWHIDGWDGNSADSVADFIISKLSEIRLRKIRYPEEFWNYSQ